MQEQFNILEEILKTECGSGPVYYLPNPGNWGDGLIRYGTLKFLNDIGLNYKELTRNIINWFSPVYKGGTVIYGGGGGWCELWHHSAKYVSLLRHRFKVIVLPSTFESSYSIPGITFFRRDVFESRQRMPDAVFCHDMAFYIGNQFFRKMAGTGKGYFFRCDAESADKISIPASNIDISMKGTHLSEVSQFFDEINRFAVIYTDRLHVSIAACLLKKELHFYPGSYFKNQAVYLSSIKDYFDNVHFHDCFEGSLS